MTNDNNGFSSVFQVGQNTLVKNFLCPFIKQIQGSILQVSNEQSRLFKLLERRSHLAEGACGQTHFLGNVADGLSRLSDDVNGLSFLLVCE
jgi:hypothetical protein